MRERGPLWEQFSILSAAKGGGPGRVMCKSCDWTGAANSTRMRLHALENHPDIPPSTSPSKEPTASTATPAASDSTHAAVVASQAVLKQQRRHVYHLQKKRQRSLTDFCDRRITGDEQRYAILPSSLPLCLTLFHSVSFHCVIQSKCSKMTSAPLVKPLKW